MTRRVHPAQRPLAISALTLSLACAPLFPVQAEEPAKRKKPGSEVLTQASLKGLYAYANLAEAKAGYGVLKLDGLGNLTTDDISVNLLEGDLRRVVRLGPGAGTYSVDPSGVGNFNITFHTPEPDITYTYEFVVTNAVREGKKHAPLATEVFTASTTTGVANATVTFLSPLNRKTGEPVAKFNLASLEGRYAYANNADSYASYGVMVFDGKGNVHSDGKLSINIPTPDGRTIVRVGPGQGTYTVDSNGRGSFYLEIPSLNGAVYTWEFVITQALDEEKHRAALATELFGVIPTVGIDGQLVAPTLSRIFPPKH